MRDVDLDSSVARVSVYVVLYAWLGLAPSAAALWVQYLLTNRMNYQYFALWATVPAALSLIVWVRYVFAPSLRRGLVPSSTDDRKELLP